MPRMISLAAVSAFIALLGGSTSASTLDESQIPGGNFSGLWSQPTAIGAGVTTILGTGNGNQYDTFVFTALPAGAQTLSLNFSAPAGIGYSYAAGGAILTSTQPFRWGWDGSYAASVYTGYWQPTQSITLNFGPSFSGPLYLALNFTYGQNLNYSIGLPQNAVVMPPPPPPVAPVPVPAAGFLMAAALAAIGGAARRRSKASAA